MARKHNGKAPTKVTQDLANYLLETSTLQRWAGYSLKQRVNDIKKLFDIDLHITTLR